MRWEREVRGGEGEEGEGGGRGENNWEKEKEGGKNKKILHAWRAPPKERRGRQGRGMVEGGELPPPPPGHHLIHPSIKKHKYKHFRVMSEFNPRQQYIGVYLYS